MPCVERGARQDEERDRARVNVAAWVTCGERPALNERSGGDVETGRRVALTLDDRLALGVGDDSEPVPRATRVAQVVEAGRRAAGTACERRVVCAGAPSASMLMPAVKKNADSPRRRRTATPPMVVRSSSEASAQRLPDFASAIVTRVVSTWATSQPSLAGESNFLRASSAPSDSFMAFGRPK